MVKLKRSLKNLELDMCSKKMGNSAFCHGTAWKFACHGILLALLITDHTIIIYLFTANHLARKRVRVGFAADACC